uniref:Uncharacterized protein n=1 Tax=Anguilla anguilla TaxID=7936 RepID=A0A0E9PIW6_ANGAN
MYHIVTLNHISTYWCFVTQFLYFPVLTVVYLRVSVDSTSKTCVRSK